MGVAGTAIAEPVAPTESDAVAPGRRRTLAHEPALDGLRGIAVMAVVVFHMDRLKGGFLGVDLFFVLSGFLITSLLLDEARTSANGNVGLGAFWARRARRLLPALWLLLVVVAVLLLLYTPEVERGLFRDDALATLGYVANWQRVTATASYWDLFSQQSPLEHMWSLAIEEQFYVVWPLVAVLLLGRGRGRAGGPGVSRVRWVALGGAAVSLVWMALTYKETDTNWAYFSTPTRLGPTLLGAGLATVALGRARRTKPQAPEWDILALAALFVMTVLVLSVDGLRPLYYRGGLAVFALASCAVIWAVTGGAPGLVGRLLSVAPLRWLGLISYGVYLWHWPIFVYVSTERLSLVRWQVDALRLVLTLAAAGASFVWLERPIRRGALRGRRAWVSTGVAVAVTLGAVLIATNGKTRSVTLDDAADLADALDEPQGEIDNPILHLPAPRDVPDDAVKLLLVGDSGPTAWGPEMVDVAEEADGTPPVAVAWASQYLCSIVNADGPTLAPDETVIQEKPCHGVRRRMWRQLVDQYDPDVVVYYLANAGFTQDHLVAGQWVPECDPRYDAYLEDALRDEATLLTAGGAEMVYATSPYTATLLPGSHETVDCRNATFLRAAGAVPGARVVDLNGYVAGLPDDSTVFVDSVHFAPSGGRRAARWLLPQVQGWFSDEPDPAAPDAADGVEPTPPSP